MSSLPSPALCDLSQVAQTETSATATEAARAPPSSVSGPNHHRETPRLRGTLNIVPAAYHDRGPRLEFV